MAERQGQIQWADFPVSGSSWVSTRPLPSTGGYTIVIEEVGISEDANDKNSTVSPSLGTFLQEHVNEMFVKV